MSDSLTRSGPPTSLRQRGLSLDLDLDWVAIANVLGERVNLPILVLDQAGRIRMLNAGMEQLLGFDRFELEGQRWSDACIAPEQEPDVQRWLNAALRGTLRGYDTTVLTKAGERVRLHVEFLLAGLAPGQGLLITATRVMRDATPERAYRDRDLDYEIAVIGAQFGALSRLCADGEFVTLLPGHERCFRLLYGLQRPCDDCPLLAPCDAPWPRTVVRSKSEAMGGRARMTFEIVTVEPSDPAHARVRVRSVSEDTLGAIHKARVDELAQRAGLSPREREVLGYLLLGRNLEDMAKLIGISPRTVKHHQASALEKLGAESRADLIRLVL